jgi:PAS domain S-box-containing protein
MDDRPDRASRLRRQAKEIAVEETALQQEKLDDLPREEARRTLQELRIHQIELELQNEELRRAREELEISRQRYFDLYDQAPSSYLTIDEHGLIREANLTAATLLGEPRGVLHAQPFSRYVHKLNQNTYYLHRRLLVKNGEQQTYDLRMVKKGGTEFWAQVTATLERDGDGGAQVSHITVTDITERKQSEDALLRANERLDMAKIAAGAGVWDWDVVSGRIEWSPEMFRLFGIDPGKDTAGFDSWRAALHPEDRQAATERIESAVREGSILDSEYRVLLPDGTIRWINARGRTVYDRHGQPVRMLGICMDVTSRRLTEEALRYSEDRYRSLVELSPDAVFVNRNNRIVFVNQAAVRLFGASSADELVGKDPFDLRLPEYHATFRARNERCLDGEATPHIEGKILRLDGSIVDVEEAAARFETEEGEAIQVILRDITERKRGEEKLRELTQRLAYHVDNSPLAVVEWGPDMRLTRWAGEAERIFGWKAEEVLGKRMEDFQWIYTGDQALVAEVSADLQAGTNPRRFSENRNYRKDGSVIFCEWYNSSFVDPSGNLKSILSLILDITARKEAETALQESLAEKEVLLREVHHRVKNNLASIVGLLELQKEGITDEAALDSLKELSDRVLSMSLIHERLYRSKNMARIEFQPYLSELASQLLASYGAGSCISCRVEAMGVEAGLDTAIPIGLIVNELVTNAIKYAFPKGIPRQGSEECEIVISALMEDDTCTLTVSDNGAGMPPDLDWRSCPSLGLRLVSMLGEHQLGGQLRLDRAEGTCFVLTFSEQRRDARGR